MNPFFDAGTIYIFIVLLGMFYNLIFVLLRTNRYSMSKLDFDINNNLTIHWKPYVLIKTHRIVASEVFTL